MSTKIKVEVIFLVPGDAVQTEADLLNEYLRDYKPQHVSGNSRGPFFERLEISRENKTWDKVK